MSIDVTSAQSARFLLPVLAERLSTRRTDPFFSDIIVVPGIGVADWITEELATLWGPSGIVANTTFWLPNEFNVNVGARAGIPRVMTDVHVSQWLVLEHLTSQLRLGRELAPGFRETKRKFSFAKRVAQLFDKYAVHRPEMMSEWREGRDTDGFRILPTGQMWQPRLWRELLQLAESRNETLPGDAERPNIDNRMDLTRSRLTLFGVESFSRSKIALLRSLSEANDIAVYHVTPFPGVVGVMRDTEVVIKTLRHEVEFPYSFKNPLMRSWGHSTLESGALLSTISREVSLRPSDSPPSVLSALQRTLSEDLPDDGEGTPELLSFGDATVQIHLCHGATRQVEVLRDALLHLLKNDPTMRPRDILVLCKDIENFGPLLEPILSVKFGDQGHQMAVTVLDSSTAMSTPVADAVNSLLSLFTGRCSSLEIIEVLSMDPIRRRFSLTDESLAAVSGWVTDLNVNWGLDSTHRERWGIPRQYEQGTWQLAVDRLVAGILNQSPELTEHFPGVAAHDDVSGSDIETIGSLHSFVSEVSRFARHASEPRGIGEWSLFLSSIADVFLEVDREQIGWVLEVRALADSLSASSSVAPTALITLGEFREIVADGLPSLRNGSQKWRDVVRVGTPNRLRGVPARVVAILGFGEDIFRSGSNSEGDDILSRDPRIGETDVRLEERGGMLTALNAASDFLIVTCDGHDVNNNQPIPLPVPLIELQDAVALAISTIEEPMRSSVPICIWHSRQLADPVNVGLETDSESKNVQMMPFEPWTFDETAVEVVARLSDATGGPVGRPTDRRTIVLPEPPLAESERAIELTDLYDSVRRPIDNLVRSRLQILLAEKQDTMDPLLPLWPDPLTYSSIGRDFLSGVTSGRSPGELKKMQDLAFGLPLGALGDATWAEVETQAEPISATVSDILKVPVRRISLDLDLPLPSRDGAPTPPRSVLAKLEVHGDTVLSLNFSKWNRRFRLWPWLQIAALTIHQPDIKWKAMLVARPEAGPPMDEKEDDRSLVAQEEFQLKGETPDERAESAGRVLRFAHEIHSRSMRTPIPLFERSSWLPDASKSVRGKELGYDLDRPSHQLIYPDLKIEDFLGEPLVADVDVNVPSAPSRYEGYSRWLLDTWNETVQVLRTGEKTRATKTKKTKGAVKPSIDSEEK